MACENYPTLNVYKPSAKGRELQQLREIRRITFSFSIPRCWWHGVASDSTPYFVFTTARVEPAYDRRGEIFQARVYGMMVHEAVIAYFRRFKITHQPRYRERTVSCTQSVYWLLARKHERTRIWWKTYTSYTGEREKLHLVCGETYLLSSYWQSPPQRSGDVIYK